MFQRKDKEDLDSYSNSRNHTSHGNGSSQNSNTRLNSNSGSQKFRTFQSAEKMLEKYNALAKEAMSSGDKTLSENYLQHADHYIRIIEDKK